MGNLSTHPPDSFGKAKLQKYLFAFVSAMHFFGKLGDFNWV